MNIKYNKFLWFVFITVTWSCSSAFAQKNTFEEVMPYKDINGYMVIKANVGGTEGDFLLDPRGAIALTESAAAQRKIKVDPSTTSYPRTGYQSIGKGTAFGFFIGKNVYLKDISVMVLKEEPLLKKLGVDGVINFSVFTNAVLTINSKIKTFTISSPYRPSYIKLANRADAQLISGGVAITADLNGKLTNFLVDFYEEHPLLLSKQLAKEIIPNAQQQVKEYNKIAVPKVKLANEVYLKPEAYTSSEQAVSVIGKELLNKGIISFDLDKNKYYFQPFGQGEESGAPALKKDEIVAVAGKVNSIDRDYFLNEVYDYRNNKEWKTKGNKPVVVDFWATWCGPCMRMMPIMEELALKYKDQILFYKVNVDKEGELRDVFKANAIPLMIFAPLDGKITTELGADTKEKVEEKLKKLIL
ncbi:thioredoxin domain-containing protein [Pedobacter punctiformis]|uniref:Thioredoxin domain-containing protein n=1 Tax=Pedobacter punctiformis TaxID=3004097 RepID=A0ABT4LE57_9SPHI|nr:thioredoxin domain-containing protein [Pedobacter sp. HCMS5-2]MCZ4245129.1 thioredoxin domain-containing protein [Pedobacter sp. HCMS5-2]